MIADSDVYLEHGSIPSSKLTTDIVREVIEPTGFRPTDYAYQIFRDRYAHTDEDGESESWSEACRRVAEFAAQNEANPEKWADIFYHVMRHGYVSPAGRVWRNAGTENPLLDNCVAGDTIIQTESGARRAKELEGETVNVLCEDGKFREAEWDSYGEQPLLHVQLDNGDTIRATPDHDWVAYGPGGRERNKETVKTTELEGRRIPVSTPDEFNYDDDEFENGVRHGLVYGDGTIDETGAKIPQFGDSEHLLHDWFSDVKRYNDGTLIVTGLNKDYKSLPTFDDSPSYVRGFIAGLVAADGHIAEGGRVMLHQADNKALTKIRDLASHANLATGPVTLERKESPFDGSEKPLWKLVFRKEGFDGKMILKNNHEENWTEPKASTTVKVESVKDFGEVEEVYCCVEPETHTMTVEHGIVTRQCFTAGSIPDTREGWAERAAHDLIHISMHGAGWGCDLSELRPKGAEIQGLGGGQEANAVEDVMNLTDQIGETVKSAGNRRAALWEGLSARHPDFPEFVDMKSTDGDFINMNISVSFFEDPANFFNAVENDYLWHMHWEHDEDEDRSVNRTEPAAEIWDTWFENMVTVGDPAIMNFHKANEKYNCSYLEGKEFNDGEIVSCNACTEQTMLPYETCTLSNLVLPRFFDGLEERTFDWNAFKLAARIQTRLLDNLIENQKYLDDVPEHEFMKKQLRRIGNGFMGLAEWLVMHDVEYGSPESFDYVDALMAEYTTTVYDESVNLAIEREPFPEFDAEGFTTDGFVERLPEDLVDRIRTHGIRHSILMNCPPTGTTSQVQGVTGGIEPMQATAYERTYRDDDDEWATEFVMNDLYKDYLRKDLDTSAFTTTLDVDPYDELHMVDVVTNWVDANVSKTVIMPPEYDDEDIEDIIMEWAPELVAFTFYQLGSKDDQPITPVPEDEAEARLEDGDLETGTDAFDLGCEDGKCGI